MPCDGKLERNACACEHGVIAGIRVRVENVQHGMRCVCASVSICAYEEEYRAEIYVA